MRNDSIKFSVILSIYNVERYLERCIHSVINQTYRNLEIILVDDGSPDGCPEICDKWKKADNRIKVIHKKNAGLGMARNSGLEIATGDYVCFFDSDDYIELTLFEDVAELLNIEAADLVEFGHYGVDSSGTINKEFVPTLDKDRFCGSSVREEFWPELICTNPRTGVASNLLMSAWCGIYKKECLDRAKFKFVSEREIVCEDIYSLMCLMPDINSVLVIPKAYYYYCENETSLTHTYKVDRFERIIYFQEELQKLCTNAIYTDEIRYRINRPFLDNLLACIKMEVGCINVNGVIRTIKNIRYMCKHPITQNAVYIIPKVSYSRPRRLLHMCIKRKCVIGILILILLQEKLK
ncbi:glycosyltransferase [uncultured Clostridium sp.]|uniref:glycosyltransferase family 2 protein n=1 Tax=uncultured Clostridium sp. TaxID=59620 RepID=UPI0025DCABC4|nr:glycosyltransferase [uncultured Clostridium sp.]